MEGSLGLYFLSLSVVPFPALTPPAAPCTIHPQPTAFSDCSWCPTKVNPQPLCLRMVCFGRKRTQFPLRGVYISLTFPIRSVLCSVLKEAFKQRRQLKNNSHFPLENPPVLGVWMGGMMWPRRSCVFMGAPPPPCPKPAEFARQISSGAGCSQHTSHCLSQGLLAATEVRCRWLTRNYGGQKNVDVLAKSILWRPLSFPNIVTKKIFLGYSQLHSLFLRPVTNVFFISWCVQCFECIALISISFSFVVSARGFLLAWNSEAALF